MENIYNDKDLRQYDDLMAEMSIAEARRKYKGHVDVDAQWERFKRTRKTPRRVNLWMPVSVAVAACVALAVFFIGNSDELPAGVGLSCMDDGRMCLAVTHNMVYKHTLDDGSTVELQSGASLIYPEQFNGGERVVELRGEGVFDVISDKARPFKVVTDNAVVKVHGTRFCVMADSAQSHMVKLYEGSVTVYNHLLTDSVMLRPGDEVEVENMGDIVLASGVSMGISNEGIAYSDTQLRVILADVCKMYGVRLADTASPMLDLHVNFAAPHGISLDKLIERLNMLDAINLEIDGQVIRPIIQTQNQ